MVDVYGFIRDVGPSIAILGAGGLIALGLNEGLKYIGNKIGSLKTRQLMVNTFPYVCDGSMEIVHTKESGQLVIRRQPGEVTLVGQYFGEGGTTQIGERIVTVAHILGRYTTLEIRSRLISEGILTEQDRLNVHNPLLVDERYTQE